MTYIEKLDENDILLGRGGKNNQWIGNERLRKMARSRCIEYQTAQKKGKSEISREIVIEVRSLNGRFLRRVSKGWEDVDDKIAREKVSQVLRDAIHARKLNKRAVVRNDTEIKASSNAKEEGKEMPQQLKRTPVNHSSEQSCRWLPEPVGSSNNHQYPENRPTENIFSPDTLPLPHSLPHPCTLYGRVSISEASLNRRHSGEDATHFSVPSSLSHQYPVTPSSSNIAMSTAKKRRQRYFQGSPLVQGYHHYDPYHQYPYPTPIRQNASPAGMPPVSMRTSSPNIKSRGLVFSPPARSISEMPSRYNYSNVNAPFSSDRRNSLSLQTSSKEEFSISTEITQLPLDLSQQQLHLSTTNSSGSNPEFDFLLNDEDLSDLEHKNHSPPSFPSTRQDDSI